MNQKTKVATLSATNFKGSSFTHQLAPVTLFYGPPREGKTTRLDALTLALLGYLPQVGKNVRLLFDGGAMGVGVDYTNPAFNGGQATGRRWQTVRGSLKYSGSGDALDFPSVALDVSVFLDLSGPEQVKALFRSSSLGSDLTVLNVCNKIAGAVDKAEIEGDLKTRRAVQKEVSDWVMNYQPEEWDNTVQSLLEGLVAEAAEKKKAATQSVQRMEKTMQGMTRVGDGAAADPEAETKLSEARVVLLAAEKDLAAKVQAGQTASSELNRLKSVAATWVDVDEARNAVAGLEAKMKEITERGTACPDVDAAVAEYHAAFTNHSEAKLALDSLRSKVKAASDAVTAAKSEKVCSHCGQSVVELKKEIVKKREDELAALTKVGVVDPAPLLAVVAEKELAKQNAFEALRAYKTEQHNLQSYRSRVDELNQKINSNAEAEAARNVIPEREQYVQELRTGYTLQEAQVRAARQVVADCEVGARALVAQRAVVKQRAEAAAELERCRIEEQVWKSLQAALKSELAELTEASIGGFLVRAGVLFKAVLGEELAYKDGEFGIRRMFAGGETFWSHRSFSGTERALFEAGLSYALAKDAPIKIVIVDELGRMDVDYKQRLLKTLLGLIQAGEIDQALLADPSPPESWGFTETELTKSIKIEKE